MAWRAAPGRAWPTSRPTSGPRWWPTTWRSSHASSRHSPAHNRARYKTGRRPALDHVRILPRTPTATTTYYHVGKIPSLDIKNCTNPAPAACGQPKTPAKHPVYGRTLARHDTIAESGSLSRGLPVRLQLLPTPPHDGCSYCRLHMPWSSHDKDSHLADKASSQTHDRHASLAMTVVFVSQRRVHFVCSPL